MERNATRNNERKGTAMLTYTFNGRKNAFGEYVIRCEKNGVRHPEGEYHTNDKKDAMETLARLKANAEEMKGNTVNTQQTIESARTILNELWRDFAGTYDKENQSPTIVVENFLEWVDAYWNHPSLPTE